MTGNGILYSLSFLFQDPVLFFLNKTTAVPVKKFGKFLTFASRFFPAILMMVLIYWFSGNTGSQVDRMVDQLRAGVSILAGSQAQTAQAPAPAASKPGGKCSANQTSAGLLLFAPLSKIWARLDWFKLGHVIGYALLGLAFHRAFYPSLNRKDAIWAATLTCAVYAGLDEFHQSFVPGRAPLIMDVVLDTCSALGILLLQSVLSRKLF